MNNKRKSALDISNSDFGGLNIIPKIRREAKKYFVSARGSHDWDHTERVLNLAIHIGKKEKANLDILTVAALLHDIKRKEQDEKLGEVCHAELAANESKKILKKYELENNFIKKVSHCIKTHRFRGNNIPKSKEAKILFDSDKLDSIGAVGIGRAFLFAGELGAKLHNPRKNPEETKAYSEEDTAYREFSVSLRKKKDEILTNEGKKIAKERHKFMVEFFDRLNKEVKGLQ